MSVADLGQDVLGWSHEYLQWQYRNKQFDLENPTPEAIAEQARIFRLIHKRVMGDKYIAPTMFVKPVSEK